MFSNRLDDLIDSFDEEDVISRCQNRDSTSPRMLATGRNKVAGHSEIDEKIEDVNKNTFDVSFFY